MHNQRVLITGGAGLIGSHIADLAVQEAKEVIVLDNFVHGRRENLAGAMASGRVTVVEGDAHQTIARLKDPIDVLFIDADKEGYVDYLNKLLPLVRPGGLILAHNVDMVADYNRLVTSNPALETLFYMEGEGLGITLKKR